MTSLASHQTFNSAVLGTKQETIIIPSQSQPNWGGTFTIDIKERGAILNSLYIVFNLSSITGLTGSAAGFPNYSPTSFMVERCDIVQSNQIIHTVYQLQNFLDMQLFSASNEDALMKNYSTGLYSSNTHRAALAAVNGNNYYFHLSSYLRQAQIALLPGMSTADIQLRFQMAPLSSVVNQGTLTGTPISTINFCQCHLNLTRLSNAQSQAMVNQIVKSPKTFLFSYPRIVSQQIPSGVTTFSFVLSALTSAVSHMYFVVRPSNALTGSGAWNFAPLQSWVLLSGGGSPLTSSNVILDRQSRHIFGDIISRTTYLSDVERGDSNSYVYVWQFCPSAYDTFVGNSINGGHLFTGQEQLQISFPSAIATGHQLDLFAFSNYSLTMGMSSLSTSPVNQV